MANSCAESIPSFAGAFDFCAPAFTFGEIEEIIIAPLELETGDPYPTDWTDETAWDVLLSPTLPDEPIAFKIPVRGTIDEPDRPEIEASRYRKAWPPKRYNMPVAVDDISDEGYTALRQMINKRVRLWFLSGGYLFGSPTGVEADVDSWYTIEEGEDSIHKYHLHFSWRSKYPPERVVSPFEPVVPTPTV
jgi:hypothetical protein